MLNRYAWRQVENCYKITHSELQQFLSYRLIIAQNPCYDISIYTKQFWIKSTHASQKHLSTRYDRLLNDTNAALVRKSACPLAIITRYNSRPAANGYALSMMYVLPRAGDVQLTPCRYGITKLITAFTKNCRLTTQSVQSISHLTAHFSAIHSNRTGGF
jgi:hypothetical protein